MGSRRAAYTHVFKAEISYETLPWQPQGLLIMDCLRRAGSAARDPYHGTIWRKEVCYLCHEDPWIVQSNGVTCIILQDWGTRPLAPA